MATAPITRVKWPEWSVRSRHLPKRGQNQRTQGWGCNPLITLAGQPWRRCQENVAGGNVIDDVGGLWFYWGCRRTLSMAAMNKWFSITICQGTKPIRHYYLFTQAIMQVNTHTRPHIHTRTRKTAWNMYC